MIVGLCLIAFQTGNPAWAEPLPEFDHHDPAALNEAAMQYLKVGAGGTALILLERACVLQPHDSDLRANLAALRTYLVHPGAVSSSTAINMSNEIEVKSLAQFPPPWPAKSAP
jgi:hypothetical protein